MAGPSAWPIRCGTAPPLADGFSARPESMPEFATGFRPGRMLAFVPGRTGWPNAAPGWRTSTGKTQLAAYFAESLWRAGGLDLLAWVDGSNRASVLAGYGEAAAAAVESDPAGDAESVAARLLNWLETTSRRWLVVLDAVTDGQQLAGLWPAGPTGMVVLTAADPAWVPGGHGVQLMPVGMLSARESMSYVRGRLAGDPDLRSGMIDLASELGGEPMALAQASGVIASARLSCRDYLSRFSERREQAARVSAGGHPAAASLTWQLAAEHVDWISDGLAWPILTAAALLDGHGIPGSAFASTAMAKYLAEMTAGPVPAHDEIGSTLALLERTGMIAIDHARTPPAIIISPLTQSAILASAPDQMLAAAVNGAADGLLEVWPEARARGWPAAAVRSSAGRIWRLAGQSLLADGCHQLLWHIGDSLNAVSASDALSFWSELAHATDRILGPEHPDTMLITGRLAGACLRAGDAEQAIGLYEHAAGRLSARLGPDHAAVLAARIDTGRALVASHRPGGAAAVLDQVAADCQRLFGPSHPETMRAREELGSALLAADRPGEAAVLYQQVIAERERSDGARHPDTIAARRKLAAAYLADGKFKDAIAYAKRALADLERSHGPDHLQTAAARGDLGSAYHAAGRMAAAVQLHEQASAGYQKALGPDHPETLARRANLARAYFAVGRLSDARTLLRDIVERCERSLPPGDPLTQTVRDSLANAGGLAEPTAANGRHSARMPPGAGRNPAV